MRSRAGVQQWDFASTLRYQVGRGRLTKGIVPVRFPIRFSAHFLAIPPLVPMLRENCEFVFFAPGYCSAGKTL
jgi:hypothetical protein